MVHDHITPECEERFKAVDGQLVALRELAQGTQATVAGNGKVGLVTAQALVAQKLEGVENRLGTVEERLAAMESAPREVREEMAAGFGRIEGHLARLTPAAPAPQPPAQSSVLEMASPAFKVALVALGLVGTALAILAAVLGVQIGGGP